MGSTTELDALVIGAGIAGLHQLHQLRELGLRVRALDAADDVGGAWWWHDFPGARLDVEAEVYQYLFSEALYREWSWSERFPGGYEVLRWLRFVADRLDLRRDIDLGTRIRSARWDGDRGRWTVVTEGGEVVDTRFLVSCAGTRSAPDPPAGVDTFAGTVLDTARWPRRDPDLTGARVGVVGSGVSAVQLVPAIAGRVGHLTVVVDDPPYVLPRANPMYGWQDRERAKDRFAELRAAVASTASGSEQEPEHVWADIAPQRRPGVLDELHDDGTRRLWLAGFAELLTDAEVNRAVSEHVRARMRARVGDPDRAEILVPADHSVGTRRVALDTGYLEVVGRPDVTVLDARAIPARVRPEGLESADGTVHALDVLVLAPDVDAGAPALAGVDVRGRDGRALADDPGRTTFGLAKHGFPNLLTTGMPLAPTSAHSTMSTVVQQQTAWITAAIRDLLAAGGTTIEPTAAGEQAWVAHHAEVAATSLLADPSAWAGGVAAYRRRCEQEAAAGYPSFTRGR